MANSDWKEKKEFVEELKRQWKLLWWERIEDKVKAESLARQDFSMLFVERGTVIMATRDYKPLDFVQVLFKHNLAREESVVSPGPAVGGYGKFAREVYGRKQNKQNTGRKGRVIAGSSGLSGQRKKGGRGWLHATL